MSVTKFLSIGCLWVLLGTSVYAQGDGNVAAPPQAKTYEVEDFFAGIDADDNGLMSAEEFRAVGLTDRFYTFCDPDGDKNISKKEMEACELPETMDMNGDGRLTVEEVVAFEKTPLGKERGPGEPRPE